MVIVLIRRSKHCMNQFDRFVPKIHQSKGKVWFHQKEKKSVTGGKKRRD